MRLHLVDGTFELYRAHFAPRPDGRALKATIGVVRSLITLFEDPEERATHVAIAFDNPIVSFRNRLFDGYKTDEGVPPELRAQFDPVEEGARALGVVVWSMDEHEADDGLASGARRFKREVEQVRIMSPDKDLGQCLDGERVVQVDRIRRKMIDVESVRAQRGIDPKLIPDFLALVGDPSDGIPGIAGFGEKSAAALLDTFGALEAIPDDPARWPKSVRRAPALAAELAASRREASLYKQLATLVDDAPIAESLDELEWRGAPRAEWLAWCERVGAPELRDRPPRFR